ncbi:hypothetical protein E2C01_009580 [Portunus trituberculatus]|uniref:Uncharacterized protein n=1 Tax=Portunus trituberculatus TaxID=210409 RepID=A0A5B7D663_PORTR|nr:hypothetical protein [Portunus trituberculatus]
MTYIYSVRMFHHIHHGRSLQMAHEQRDNFWSTGPPPRRARRSMLPLIPPTPRPSTHLRHLIFSSLLRTIYYVRHPRFVVLQRAGGLSASIYDIGFQTSCRGRLRKEKECAVGGRHNRTQTARPPGEGGATVAVATLTSKRDVKKNGISLT